MLCEERYKVNTECLVAHTEIVMSDQKTALTAVQTLAECQVERGIMGSGVKLIRDLLALDIAQREHTSILHSPSFAAQDSVRKSALRAKLSEEIGELQRTGYSDVGEFADVLEVLVCLAGEAGLSLSDILEARVRKADQKGSFEGGYFLISGVNHTLIG